MCWCGFFPSFLFFFPPFPWFNVQGLQGLFCQPAFVIALGNVCCKGCPGMEITFLFICLPCKFRGLAAPSWAGLLSLDLWDSSGRAQPGGIV